MFGSQCMCCFKSFVKINNLRSTFYAFNSAITRNSQNTSITVLRLSFCTTTNVLPDVLKSKANEFSGTKSTVFESEEVQAILKRMTSINLDKIFSSRKENLSNPVYKVLDDEQLKNEEEKISIEAENYLKMPRLRGLRKHIDVIISQEPELIQNDEDGADYIFTDISPAENSRTRAVLVRENSTGILREATWDERDHMQFIYWPREGQTYEIAPMLLDENLPFMFDQLRHEDVLDFINVQFEVDAPDYIRVLHSVYEDIINRQAFDILKSTRYYSGMIFYYVTNHKIQNIFGYFLQHRQIGDAADIVRLHSLIHSDFQCSDDSDNESIVRKYIHRNGLERFLKYMDDENKLVLQ